MIAFDKSGELFVEPTMIQSADPLMHHQASGEPPVLIVRELEVTQRMSHFCDFVVARYRSILPLSFGITSLIPRQFCSHQSQRKSPECQVYK